MAIINKKCAKRQKMLYNPTEETASSVTQAKSVIDEMAEKAVNVSEVVNGLAADSEKWIL